MHDSTILALVLNIPKIFYYDSMKMDFDDTLAERSKVSNSSRYTPVSIDSNCK